MHIVINKSKTKQRKTIYNSVLLRESYRENGRVKKRTIANLSNCSLEEIVAMRLALKHKNNLAVLGNLQDVSLEQGKSVGAVWTVYNLAKRLGIAEALGHDFQGQLAMWQICARVISQGSRLSAVRLAQTHGLADVLGFDRGFDENDLYANLAWLSDGQKHIEQKLFKLRRRQKKSNLFLYDVTSSYLEGTHNALGAFGYNRDKKRGKEQIVIGLLCDEYGEPVSVEVFEGNTIDGKTVPQQIEKLANELGCSDITFVGDRAMLKSTTVKALPEHFHYITAITKPQIESLLAQGTIQLELFQNEVCEVQSEGVRYILRKNPYRAAELKTTRKDKQIIIEELIQKKNIYLNEHQRAKTSTAKKGIERKIKQLKAEKWLSVDFYVTTNKFSLITDEIKLAEAEKLDGCYVIKTDLAKDKADKTIVHDRYRDLAEVEKAFRYCKTGLLEIRPVYVQSEKSTRGHVLIVMLSYLILKHLQEAWREFDLTAEEGLANLDLLCSTKMSLKNKGECLLIPRPNKICRELLEALKISMPESLPHREVLVVTRKKLPSRRRQA